MSTPLISLRAAAYALHPDAKARPGILQRADQQRPHPGLSQCLRAVLLGNATRGVRQLAEVEPFHVAAFVRQLQSELSAPTVKQHLAALRMLFDWLVTGHIIDLNPAHAVRGPKCVVKTGKTAVLAADGFAGTKKVARNINYLATTIWTSS